MIHWCLVSIGAIIGICFILRLVIVKLINNKEVLDLVDEFIGDVVSSVFILELFFIGSKYGPTSWESLICGFIHLFFKNIYFMAKQLYASPLSFCDWYYSSDRKFLYSTRHFVQVIFVQTVAMLVGQRFAKLMWVYEDVDHVEMLDFVCLTTISANHPWLLVAFAEAAGVFVSCTIDFVTPYVLKPVVRSIVILTLIFNFGHFSGLWMNPVIATTFTFRCKGHASDWQYFIIYWIAPFLGLSVAWEMRFLAKKFAGMFKKTDKVKAKTS